MKPVLILPLAKVDDMVLAIFVPTFQFLGYNVTPSNMQHTSEAWAKILACKNKKYIFRIERYMICMWCRTNKFKTLGRGQSAIFVFTPYAISLTLLRKRVRVNLVPRSYSHFLILNWLHQVHSWYWVRRRDIAPSDDREDRSNREKGKIGGKWIFWIKKFHLLHSPNFKFLIQMIGSLKNVIFLRFVTSVRGGHCDYSPQRSKHMAIPLCTLQNY